MIEDVKICLDSRKRRDGSSQVMLRCGDDKFGTGFTAREMVGDMVVNDPYALLKNKELHSRAEEVMGLIISGYDFRPACERVFKRREKRDLIQVFEEFMATKQGGTWGIYRDCLRSLRIYHKSFITLDEMSKRWLMEYDDWMRENQHLSTNTRSIRMRCIRAVCNYAIGQEYTDNYPFKSFCVKQEETRKRCLTREQFISLRDYPCEPWQEPYRDVWLLMFYLIGINAVDLWSLTYDNVSGGRINYRRQKTGKRLSIKIEPEAQAILDKYRGEKHLLSLADTKSHTTFAHGLAETLSRMGEYTIGKRNKKEVVNPIMPSGFSAYWSRHTWATLAYEAGVSVDYISQALSHSDDSHSTTMIYIRQDAHKVDEANRRVLDYVNEGNI